MAKRNLATFRRDERAAIAPLYALALFGLAGIAGVGWDYGRMMAMDSELQNAADQAALAAATQLDGGMDAITRARSAATDYLANADSEWVNVTRNANDGAGSAITDLDFRFYESYDSESDTFGDEITDESDGSDAKVVQVIVNGRETFFALTPIVGLISSGGISADAVAGLETATCNVPPLMFCVPTGDSTFPGTDDVGKGISMHVRASQADAWAPGNFGFLNIDYDIPPNHQNHTTGMNSDFLGCAGDVIESRTGNRTPEMRALNSRFDLYENGGQVSCNSSTGDFCPAQNTQKNYVVQQSFNSSTHPSELSCNASPNGQVSWIDAASTSGADAPVTSAGFPKDNGMGTSDFGSGQWDYDGYMTAVHGGADLSAEDDLDGNGTFSRYEVYQWELADPANRLPQGRKVGYDITQTQTNGQGRTTYRGNLYCAYPRPITGTAVVPSSIQKDRRVLTVAAVDCTGLNGHAPVNILRWVDLFLVRPAETSSSDQSFFAEVMGAAEKPGGEESAFQYYGRNKPVLLR